MTRTTPLLTKEVKFQQFLDRLACVRRLESQIRVRGLEAASDYIEDVEGNWLETWGQEEEQIESEKVFPYCPLTVLPIHPVRSSLEDLSSAIAFSEFVPFTSPSVRKESDTTIALVSTPFKSRFDCHGETDSEVFPFPGTEELYSPEEFSFESIATSATVAIGKYPIATTLT